MTGSFPVAILSPGSPLHWISQYGQHNQDQRLNQFAENLRTNTFKEYRMTTLLTKPAPWVPDLGTGQYMNPVLYADYSDPDAIRVGDDYWMTSSSFCHVPGLPILHSRDLVNWALVNHALPRLTPEEHFSQTRHGGGVWAPALRYHDGWFWIFFPDPDYGLYVIKTRDPRGAWSEPRMLKAGKGLIDPCPLWDDDGSAYLIHGWARSRSGINNRLTLHRMSPDATRVLDEGTVVVDANKIEGWHTLEGPKLYKRGCWYYIFAPSGGVRDGYQAVFRSKDIRGPYEVRIVLEQGSSPINGPHQGAWVDTPLGEHWFLHFQEVAGYGRLVHLQPMDWLPDGWVGMGVNRKADGKGEPVLTHRKPALPAQAISVPATSDDFSGGRLGLQWQWQANPQKSWARLEQPGLSLLCVPLSGNESLYNAPQLLLQKLPAPRFTADTCLELKSTTEGLRAGLIVFGYDYAWIGLNVKNGRRKIAWVRNLKACEGKSEELLARDIGSVSRVWLRAKVSEKALCQFEFSLDGKSYQTIGEPFTASLGPWVGGKIGLFAASACGTLVEDYAHFSFFRVE
jgi:beta-xylosidase